MKSVYVCLVDKNYPPEHSFVEGMLAKTLPSRDRKVYILCSSDGHANPSKLHKSICVPKLFPRRGAKRLFNFYRSFLLSYSLLKKNDTGSSRLKLFVRNDPIFLASAVFLKLFFDVDVIYQQSFPHELANPSRIKRAFAVLILKLFGGGVSSILAVTPLALQRLKAYFPPGVKGDFIPLLVSGDEINPVSREFPVGESSLNPVRFVYIGTHSPNRKLDVVLSAFLVALDRGANAEIWFIGSTKEEFEDIKTNKSYRFSEAVSSGRVFFEGKLPRDELMKRLQYFHVGVCIIPPNKIYQESSPTKLTEYMASGLVVLANIGIKLQESYVKASGGGYLVEWGEHNIADGFYRTCSERGSLHEMSQKSIKYVEDNLTYDASLDKLINL